MNTRGVQQGGGDGGGINSGEIVRQVGGEGYVGPGRNRGRCGGERMQDVYVSGEAPGADRHVEVTGVDFYQTIEQLPVIERLYRGAKAKMFDFYELVRRGVRYLVVMLRALHTGVLPAYLRWILAGLLVVVWVVTQTGTQNNSNIAAGEASINFPLFTRLGYVALQPSWGSLSIGKQWGVYYDVAGFTDWFPLFGGEATGTRTGMALG